MPDFFINNSRAQFNQNEDAVKNMNQSSKSYWDEQNARMQQKNAEYVEDLQRYSVNIPQEQYNIIKDAIANAEVPEDEAYRWAAAMEINNQYNIPIQSAYQNLESINAALWGEDYQFTPKTNFKAIVDNGRIGANTLKMGEIGNKIMLAESKLNDGAMFYGEKELQELYEEYARLEQENASLSDNQARPFVIEALKFGAQSVPFTGAVIGASALGTLLAPGVGTVAGFATSMANASGLQYIKLREAGSSQDAALGFSLVSGGLQALVEVSLGNVAGALGKTTLGDMAGEAVSNTITGNLFKRLTYDGTFKTLALRLGKEYVKENFEEGLEEVIQDLIEKGTDALAAEFENYEIDSPTAKQIARDAWENFRGGLMGSLVLGLPTSAIKVNADIKDFATVRSLSEEVDSQELFNVLTEDNPIFRDMTTQEKREAQKTTWENGQARKEARATEDARQIAEGRDAAEGAEEMAATEEGEEAQAQSVARDESGRLYTSDDGGTFLAGDATKNGKEEGNRYGYIKYTTDENGDITIDTFKMTEGREGLRNEVYDEFAREHPNVNINWNAIGSETQAMRQSLIDANPSGSKNGLNYYSSKDIDQIAARKQVAAEVRKNIHNVTKNADGTYTRTDLSNKQVAAAVTLIESAAKRMDMSLSDYVSKTFGNQIFGTREQFAQSALAQGDTISDKAGGMNQGVAQANWKQVGQQVKAVIYAGENADFSTWAHEMAHVFQNQLDGDLKTEAENAFSVVNGDWINSQYTFSDGRTMSSAEAFAYGFQDWLETGKAENQQMQNIFQKFAQFIADAYNKLKKHLNFTPEIESVFNKLLDGDDTIMSKALKAAQEEENEYRAGLKRKAEEAEATKKAEAEEAKKQAELEKEESEEHTEFAQAEQSAEEIENQLEESNEKETGNAIDNALENTNFTTEQKAYVSEVLNDETTTIAEKADAIVDAAGEQFDLFQKQEGLLYQLAGEPSIRRMAESEEKRRILADLDAAIKLEETKFKDYPAESKALRIRMATGWERDANGQWKYELDDRENRIKGANVIKGFMQTAPEMLSQMSEKAMLNLGDIYDAPELYKVFPYMKAVRVSFYSDPNAFRAVLTPEGIKVNMRYLQGIEGEKGLKGALVHEIQHVVQAMEYADSKGLQGADIEQLYNDMMDAMQAASERKYDYDVTSLKQGLEAYMNDYGEIEARNVARRVMYNVDKRRTTTLASDEDVKRKPILYMEDASTRAADQTMYGIHNLSADNLRHVLKMGGIANPSVAVVDTEKSNFTNFGEISLIPYNYMLEKGPGMKGTYGADIYSPRYPSLTINVTDKGYNTIANIVKAVKDVDPELASTVEGKIANGIEYHGNEKRFLYDYFRIPFLAEQGYKDFYYRNESKFGNEIMDEYRKIQNGEEGAKTTRELYEQFIENKYDKELVDELKEDLKDPDKEYNLISNFEHQLWNESHYAGKIDYSGSERNAEKIIADNPELKEKFEKYVDEKLESIDRKERIFNGFTPSGNRRYLEHTLENVSKYMKQQGLEGGENFYYGLGSTRAKFTPKFTTLNQIKKARDRIVSKEDFDAIKEDMNERFDEIAERLDGGHGIDVGGERFEEAFTYGKSNPIEYLRNEYDLNISEDFAQDILNFAYELKEMPTEYFEAKFERPVYLNEFAGAIVPSNLSQDLKDALQNEGLLISEYNNEEDRQQATKDALEAFNQTRKVLFQEEAEKAGKNMQIAVNSSYDEYANEEVKGNAEAILNTKIGENTTDHRNKTRVWSIYKDLKLHKGSEIVGKKIEVDSSARPTENGWNQLREILDIFRNKSFETFRYVLIDQSGEIKKQYAVTAKMPGFAFVGPGIKEEQAEYLTKIGEEALNTNCKIVFVHNHPSGNIQQSEDDERTTERLRQVPSLYLGHMILDHNAYNLNTLSDANGSVWNQYLLNVNEKDELLKQPKKHKELFNQKINSRDALESIASKLNNVDKGTIPVCFVNYSAQITSIAYIPEELFTADNVNELRKTLEDTALKAGTCYSFAITDNEVVAEYIYENNDVLRFCDIAYYSKKTAGYIHIENGYSFFDGDGVTAQETVNERRIAYHGSAADFDKFDTEQYGMSGEGSMAFGYGTYVTDDEEIAKDYARRQAVEKYPEANRDLQAIANFMAGHNITFEEAKNIVLDQSLRFAEPYQRSKIKETFEKYKESDLQSNGKRNLYTVEIPDDIYLDWNKPVTKEIIDRIAPVYAEEMYNRWLNDSESQDGFIVYNDAQKQGIRKSFEEELQHEFELDPTYDGAQLYNHIRRKLEYYDRQNGAKLASKLLNKAGFAGLKYPAGMNYTAKNTDAVNYVIFNDDDAKIIDHLLFQTNAELMQEAQGFDSWQEFMEFCEVMHSDDEVSPIPSEADAQWYQSFWETAHGLQTEQEKNEQTVKEKVEKETTTAKAMDALFATYIRSNPEMLDDFLHEVARIDAIDLDSDEWRNVEDDMDAAERDKIDQLKDAIAITMSDYNWQSAMRRVQGGGEISEGMRKRLMGEMTDTMKSRDFRALYAEVMEDAQYAVDEEDTTASMLSKKLQKYQKRYYDIVKPGEDISKMSPEKRKRIAEAMANRDIANKIKNGSLKLDDELDAYIKSLDAQIKEKQKQFDELEKETKADYQRIADAEKRRLLKLHDELLIARSKLTQKNSDTARKINKGLKITEKYKRESQNLQANYDELFRKFNDLKNTIQITAEVQAALDRQEQVATVREDLNAKQKEKNLTAEVKKMRINLVKRTMRRVPFNRIDYDNAKTVIAIQRMLEPNLIGGVNRFIGIDSVFLRGVISQIVTDSDYKEKILNYLAKNSRSSEAFVNFKNKLTNLKSIKDFDSWTAKERKAAIKYLPKENWVRDLNLKELAKEREESIDLDIDTEEYSRPVYDENGRPKTYKDADGIEHNVTETAYRLRYSDELGRIVKDAVGADMFDRIVNMPFSEWTTEDLEQLAQRIDELYTEGRDLLAAKNEAKRREADTIRKRVEDAIKETGIVINDDDTPEEKERKQKEIDKILNLNSGLKGTEAGKTKGIKARLDRLIHGYADMNVLRFARMLDNQSEGENVRLLYRMEDDCYNAKTRSINNRARAINEIMKANNITEGDLAMSIPVPSLNTEFTVDELLYFLAADKDYAEDETKLAKGLFGIDANDDYAATSRNAVMFGNMMSDTLSQEEKERWAELDKQMKDAIENDTLTTEQKQLLTLGQLDKTPGTSAYISYCHAKWLEVLAATNSFLAEHPEYTALMEAIEADYAAQYERMNEVSINEFNMPVHRVKAYVPLVRRESNGETNANQVREDLIGAYGGENTKQWVNKGMTQRRVNISPLNQKPVETGLFKTWGSSLERTEHFIAYSPYVRQLNAVYKSRDASYTRRFIESRYGKSAIEYLDSYINEVANPNAGRIREKGSEWLHALRGKTAPAYLGWKFSAIVKQGLTSPWPYMQFVNPAEYAAAALECTRKGTYDAIREKSVFMNNRVMDPMNELVDEMAENAKTKMDRAWSKFGKKGMAGLEWIDWVCVAPGWLACYKKEYNRLEKALDSRYNAKMEELRERNMYADVGTSEYMTPDQMEAQARKEILEDIETEAVRYADDCTRQCQPSSRATDLAPLFKNSSEAMKAFLQFQTSLNVIWQNIRYDMPYAIRNKQFNRIVGTVLGYVFAGIFMNSVMDGVTSGADDDDDKEKQALRNLIFYSTTQFTDAIPIMGSEITNTMDQLITGKRGFMNSGTDMTPSATKLLSVLTNARKGNWEKAGELTAEGIGLFLGAPVSGTKEVYKLLGKPMDEGNIDFTRGISDVYGIAGDILEQE